MKRSKRLPERVHAEWRVFGPLGLDLPELELLPEQHGRARDASGAVDGRLREMSGMRIEAVCAKR